MAIRTILVPLSGGAATEGTTETACRLAHRFGAHIEALHVRADPRQTLPLLAPDISASPGPSDCPAVVGTSGAAVPAAHRA